MTVFHNSISFASNNKEPQKLIHHRPSSKDYATSMMIPTSSHQQQQLLWSQLIILLTLLLLDEKPPTSKKKYPVENTMYREVAFHGEKLYFLVTKGWQVEIFEQHETQHMMAASFVFSIPSRMASSDKTQATKAEGELENLKNENKKAR